MKANGLIPFPTNSTEIFSKGLTHSRLFLAFLSPNYFASEVCRKEWKAWIDQEIARHVLTSGSAPIDIIEVPLRNEVPRATTAAKLGKWFQPFSDLRAAVERPIR